MGPLLRPLLVALCALPAARAATVAGVLTEAQAVKQFRSATKVILKQQKADLAAVEAELEAALVALQADIETSASLLEPLQSLLPQLIALQKQGREISVSAEDQAGWTLAELLTQLVPDATPDGTFPATFFAHSGGVWDDFEDALRAQHVKAWARLAKPAEKLMKSLATSGFALTLRIDPPALPWLGSQVVGAGLALGPSPVPLTIDVVIGASSLAAANDGIVLLAGSSWQFEAGYIETQLSTYYPGGGQILISFEPTLDDPSTWGVVIDGGGDLAEGNHPVVVKAGDGCPSFEPDAITVVGIP